MAELVGGHGLDAADVHRAHGGQPVLRQPDPRPAGLAAAGQRAGRGRRPHRRARPAGPARPGAAVLRARRGERRAARGPRDAAGDGRGAGRHRPARPARARRRLPPRDRPVGGAGRGGARRGNGAARGDDRGAGGGRRGRQRARPPRRRRRGRAADPAVRPRGGGRGVPIGCAPGGSRVLRDSAAARRRGRRRRPRRHCSRPSPGSCTSPTGCDDAIARPQAGAGAARASSATSSRSARGTPPSPSSRGTRPTAPAAEQQDQAADRDPLRRRRAARARLRAGQPRLPGRAARRRGRGPAGGRHAPRSPTSWATTPRCAAPRRSGWRSSACSRAATGRRGPSCSRPATPACGCGSTTSRPPRCATSPPRRGAGPFRRRPRTRSPTRCGSARSATSRSARMWQRGVRARLRLLQGRWPEAEQDALAVLAAGDIPLGRLWPHLVLGLLAARREAPADNPHLDELWRLAVRLDVPGMLAPGRGRAGRAGVDHPPARPPAGRALVAGCRRSLPGGRRAARLRRWARRLAEAGVQQVGAGRRRRPIRRAGRAALRAGAGAVGRRVDRRAAGRAPAARRAGRRVRSPRWSVGGCASRA